MPPVFGPWSPSNARLWSCATRDRHRRRVPSHSTNSETSGPVSPSSITHVRPASPNASPERYARTASRASAIDSVTITPLPAASPSVLTTYRPGSVSRNANAASSSPAPKRRGSRAVGTPALDEHVLHPRLRTFEPGRRGRVGPNARRPGACTASTTPATSGSSGPTTTRSASSSVGELGHRRRIGRRRPACTRRASPCPGCRARTPPRRRAASARAPTRARARARRNR